MLEPIERIIQIIEVLGPGWEVRKLTNLGITLQWVGEQPFDFERFSRAEIPQALVDVRGDGWITVWHMEG